MADVIILEPHTSGHRAGYVNWIAQAAVTRGSRVEVVTLRSNASHPVFEAMAAVCGDAVIVTTVEDPHEKFFPPSPWGLFRQELFYRGLFKKMYRASLWRERASLLVVPYLDYCVNAIALAGAPFRKAPWSGIIMRQAFHLESMGISVGRSSFLRVKKALFFRLLKNGTLHGLYSNDEALVQFISKVAPELAGRLHIIWEPADMAGVISKEEARRSLGVPPDGMTILVFGVIDSRKGLDSLLRAVGNHTYSQLLRILVAGLQDNEARTILESPLAKELVERRSLYFLNRRLSDEEVFAAFKASDLVWLGYRGHSTMSGVMAQAGQMGLPVVGCREGIIGWKVRNTACGVIVDIEDGEDVYRGIDRLIRDQEEYLRFSENGIRHFRNHTPDRFGKTVLGEAD